MNFFSKLNKLLFPYAAEYPKNGAAKTITLGFQHAFAMSCATVLVPLIVGLDVGVALLAAGVGTLIFHLCTGGRMPTFLGSSFAFIAALLGVIGNSAFGATHDAQVAAAMGGVIAAGVIYLLIALIIKIFGYKVIEFLFPPVVRGVGIAIIGLGLASWAITLVQSNIGFEMFSAGYYWSWLLAGVTALVAIFLSCRTTGMMKLASVVIALVTGYVLCLIIVKTGIAPAELMNTAAIAQHSWFEVPHLVFPTFSWSAIALIAPIAIVTCVEHFGDVYANGAVVGKDFYKKPGFHRTLLGDGLASIFAGFVGAPPNTTYSENTAVLAVTGNYNPASIRVAALIAIIVAFLGKAIGVIETIPDPVLGGACIVLYGMISSVGLRTLVEYRVDFKKNRNMSIAAVMLVLAIGGATIGTSSFNFSGIALGVLAGILLNLILPGKEKVVPLSDPEAPEPAAE